MEEQKIKKPEINKKKIVSIIIVILIGIFIYTGLYTIDPSEVGVIQRFGKYLSTTEPGLHFKIPFGVDKLTKVRIKQVYKEEFGFRTLSSGVDTKYSSRDYSYESLILTGDLNIADVQWIVQYKIKSPVNFLFNVRNIRETIRNVSESAMRIIVGDHSVDEVIVLDRKGIAYDARKKIQKSLDNYKSGIEIVTVKLQNVNPPKSVKPAFNAVNEAKQIKEKMVNNAYEQYNKIIPNARGEAKSIVKEAEGYRINRVNRAKGDAAKFTKVWEKYRLSKAVTRKRMYLETMTDIIPKVDKLYIMDEDQKGFLPHMNLKGGK